MIAGIVHPLSFLGFQYATGFLVLFIVIDVLLNSRYKSTLFLLDPCNERFEFFILLINFLQLFIPFFIHFLDLHP